MAFGGEMFVRGEEGQGQPLGEWITGPSHVHRDLVPFGDAFPIVADAFEESGLDFGFGKFREEQNIIAREIEMSQELIVNSAGMAKTGGVFGRQLAAQQQARFG